MPDRVNVITITIAVIVMLVYVPRAAGDVLDAAGTPEPRSQLLGSIGGLRDTLESHGATLDLSYTFDNFWNTRGGRKTGSGFRGDLFLEITLDTAKAGWWDNGSFDIQLEAGHGNFLTEHLSGDYQAISNIDGDDFAHVSQFWYRHDFLDKALWLKAGKLDSNEDFATTAYVEDFNTSSASLPPAIAMTTWPNQDLGIVLGIEPAGHFALLLGAYNGRPDGARALGRIFDQLRGPLVMLEPRVKYTIHQHPGTLRLGLWWNGDRYERFQEESAPEKSDPLAAHDFFLNALENGVAPSYVEGLGRYIGQQAVARLSQRLFGRDSREHGAQGLYVNWDQEIRKEHPEDSSDTQGVGVFVQGSWEDGEAQDLVSYFGAGVEWTGAIPGRDDDVAGIGVFRVEFNPKAGFVRDNETIYEVYYRAQITPWLAVKPTIHYVVNPGGADADGALVAGFRGEIVF